MEAIEQIQKFKEFIEINYYSQLLEAARKGERVLVVDFAELSKFDPDLANLLLEQPEEVIKAAELAVEQFEIEESKGINVRFKNLPDTQKLMIRNIRSKHLGKLYIIEGVIRQKSDVRPQVTAAKFECPSCGNVINVLQLDSSFKEPSRCGCGRKGKFKLLSQELVDAQGLVLEESPEDLEGGEQPKRMNVFLKDDLVSPMSEKKTNPGSKISVIGIIKEIPIILKTGSKSTRFDLLIEANCVESIEETFLEVSIKEEDVRKIKEIAEDPQGHKRLVESLAPSIYGYDKIKEALLLQLMGGVRKTRKDKVVSRGDIHILLVGDPGAGKCCQGDTKIILEDGELTTIESYYEKNALFNWVSDTKPAKIFSVNENGLQHKSSPIGFFRRKAPENMLKIITQTGNEIIVTEDHPLFTTDNGLIFSKKADSFKIGEYIAAPSKINVNGALQKVPKDIVQSKANNRVKYEAKEFIDEDFSRLLGYLTGDGNVCLNKTTGVTRFTNCNKELLDDFENLIKKVFNHKVTKTRKRNTDCWDYRCFSIEIVRILEKIDANLLKTSGHMRICTLLHKSPDCVLKEFIKSLFDCEGHVRKGRMEIEFSSKSKELIYGLKYVLLRFGIISQVSSSLKCATNTVNKIKRVYYRLRISGENVLAYYRDIGFISSEKREKLKCSVISKNKLNTNLNVIPNLKAVLRVLRRKYFMSQYSLGVKRSTYQHYEKGDRSPSREKLREICRAYFELGIHDVLLEILNQAADADIFWDKIKRVEIIKCNVDYVYDLEIDRVHNFIAGGVVVHNSALLKRINIIAPKGRYVSGKGISAAGLTASVVRDEFLKGWSLEAGAMVLASNGICIVDELDKMSKEDSGAMHEALEQQCFHYDTLVQFADGSEKKIGEYVESLFINNPKKIINGCNCQILKLDCFDKKILTTDWKEIFECNIDRVSRHVAEEELIEITYWNGRTIKVTPEHPVFCIKDSQIITKRADQIEEGDWSPVPLSAPIQGESQNFNICQEELFNPRAKSHIEVPIHNDENFFKIVGYFLSEGSCEKNRGKYIGINFTNKDNGVLKDFYSAMYEFFGISPYVQERKDDHDPRWMLRYISRELADFFTRVAPEIIGTASKKIIPGIAMMGEKENVAVMLSCMFEGDGHVSKKARTIRVGYSSTSRRMCEQVQDLLLRFNIRSNISDGGYCSKVLITGYENLSNFFYEIGFVSNKKNEKIKEYLDNFDLKAVRSVKELVPNCGEQIVKLLRKYGIRKVGNNKLCTMAYDYLSRGKSINRSQLQKAVIALKRAVQGDDKKILVFLDNLAFGQIGFEKVKKARKILNDNQKWTYDITIEPHHSFISQNLVLHNTVSISKANIQATLIARTTVLAAANPKFGRFDPYGIVAEQIDLPPTLINRFDLIFSIKDLPDTERDEKMAKHILNLHQSPDTIQQDIPTELLRKYIAYARQHISPVLTDSAVEEIKNYYVKMRQSGSAEGGIKSIPISARQLEALVRMSEASAKLRLADKVTKKDARRAIELLEYCLMQVGFDKETGRIDIDRITTGISASQRSNISLVKEIINELEQKLGKNIPIEDIMAEARSKGVEDDKAEEVIEKLKRAGDIFEPKRGWISRIG